MATTFTYDFGDSSVRKIVVGKDCYSKYCVDCPYKINAFWEKKEGFRYGWMGILCCMYPCSNGVAYGIELGRGIDFDPVMFWVKATPIGHLDGYEDAKIPDRKWYDDE